MLGRRGGSGRSAYTYIFKLGKYLEIGWASGHFEIHVSANIDSSRDAILWPVKPVDGAVEQHRDRGATLVDTDGMN